MRAPALALLLLLIDALVPLGILPAGGARSTHALEVTDAVKIAEVSYDPGETPEEPFEYIELYNAGASVAFLAGAVISDEGNNGGLETAFQFPGARGDSSIALPPGGRLLLVSTATGSTLSGIDWEFYAGPPDTDDPTVPNLVKTSGLAGDLFLGNSGDGLTLSIGISSGNIIPCSEVVDGVSWEGGGSGEVYAMSSSVCTDPASHPGYANVPGGILTLQRCPEGTDTDNSSADFQVHDRTPRWANSCSGDAPVFLGLRHAPCAPGAGEPVTLRVLARDPNRDLVTMRAFFALAGAASFDSLFMVAVDDSTFEATLPAMSDQDHVRTYAVGIDSQGRRGSAPAAAPAMTFDYRVGLQTIVAVQSNFLGDSCTSSSFAGKPVNVSGAVTHRAREFGAHCFYVQCGTGPWSGIEVLAADSSFVPDLGDSVLVAGIVAEERCQTVIHMPAGCGSLLGTHRRIRPRVLGALSQVVLEENESMLVKSAGPLTVVSGFDTTNAGSEFAVTSGADTVWVGDATFAPDSVGYTTLPVPGLGLDNLAGIVAARRTDTVPPRPHPEVRLRLEPRRDNDVDRHWTDVPDAGGLQVVTAFGLRQNQPNPFNPTTAIEFTVPRAGRVRVAVYDAGGRLVRELLVRDFAAPAHEHLTWDGRDDRGRRVPSGLYLCRLEAGGRSAARKMLLVR